ncbi:MULTISPECIES: hypothetical protein [Anaerolinea]|jgi:hypothetical protein|uniref:hypothetical protein n=1 Tax=Anaerolinea TaxID=233189 RepID=UPI00262DB8EC|nr:hypothetical protein [Anaerolinea thermophila]
MSEFSPESPSQEIPSETLPSAPADVEKKSGVPIGLIIAGVVLLAGLIAGAVLLIQSDNETTARVRDVFIIFMALESLVIGVALVILIVQLAILINLINHEIRPIIQSTNQTVNTLKGTVTFLSDNLSEPVIKLNEYLAAIRKFTEILRMTRK